jgi:polysaccharide pyruvyl transferase CsaB
MKVLLAGYIGFGNLGDEAIAASVTARLEAAGHEVRLLSGQPQESRQAHGVPAYHRVWSVPRALIWADVLLFGGGGLLQDKTSRKSLTYYLTLLRLASRLGVKRVLFGQSVGPLSPGGGQAVARALDGASVLVRDAASQARLSKLGVPATLGADAALSLPNVPEATPPEGWLIIPRADVAGAQAALEVLTQRLTQSGTPVRAMALEPGADAAAAQGLKQMGATVLEAPSVREARAAVAASVGVVSVRLHGLIFAFGLGRAGVGVAYDPKVEAFASETGFQTVAVPPDAGALWAATQAARPPAEGVQRDLAVRLEDGFAWLEHTVAQGTSG